MLATFDPFSQVPLLLFFQLALTFWLIFEVRKLRKK